MVDQNSGDIRSAIANTPTCLVPCLNGFDGLVSRVRASKSDVRKINRDVYLNNGRNDTKLRDHYMNKLRIVRDKSTRNSSAIVHRTAWLDQEYSDNRLMTRMETCVADKQASELLRKSIRDWIWTARMEGSEIDTLEAFVDKSIDNSEIGQTLKNHLKIQFASSRELIVEYESLKSDMDALAADLD